MGCAVYLAIFLMAATGHWTEAILLLVGYVLGSMD
jgi:hypothetical protein